MFGKKNVISERFPSKERAKEVLRERLRKIVWDYTVERQYDIDTWRLHLGDRQGLGEIEIRFLPDGVVIARYYRV